MASLGASLNPFQPSMTLGRSRYGNLSAFGLPILTMCLSLLAWEAASLILEIPTYLVPRPSEFLLRLGTSFPEIAYQGWATAQVILLSFLLSGIIGVLLAYLLVTWESLERGVYPLLVFLQIIPKTIAAPVFLVWFGIYSKKIGLAQVPALADLYSERLQIAGYFTFVPGIAAVSAGILAANGTAIRIGGFLLAASIATLLLNVTRMLAHFIRPQTKPFAVAAL